MSEPIPQPEPVKMKKCFDCGQEIADVEKICPKCETNFEETEEELKHLEKLNRITESRKTPKPPEVIPSTPTAKKKKSLFASLAHKKGKK